MTHLIFNILRFGSEGYYGRRNDPRMAVTLAALLIACTAVYRFGQATRWWLTIVLYWVTGIVPDVPRDTQT